MGNMMQFSNDFLEQIVPGAKCISGSCPPSFFVSFEVQATKKEDVLFILSQDHASFAKVIYAALKMQVVGIAIPLKFLDEYKKIAATQTVSPHFFVLAVQDTQSALCSIAQYIKHIMKKMVIAVSGISGARHTIRILSEIVKAHNITPIPLFHDQHKNMVLEIAMHTINHRNTNTVIIFEAKAIKRHDMEVLAKAIKPSCAIISSVGQHSIDTIGSLQDVAAEHRTIFSAFSEQNIGVINGDQLPLSMISYAHPVIKFGLKISNQIQARKVRIKDSKTHFVLKIYRNKYQVHITSTHTEQLLATLAAIAMAKLLMISEEIIVSVIQKEFVIPECFEKKAVQKITDGTIISDLYTADPENVKLSLTAFHTIQTTQPKIIILGDLTGLGIHSAFWHRQIGRFLRKLPTVTAIFVVGTKSNFIQLTAPKSMCVESVTSTEKLTEELKKFDGQNPLILVKGNMPQDIKTFIFQLCEQSSII
jgi:UDP-N-acetylmuramoyl-tripeptide--D-alanyl-D-alanine ligase